MSNPYQPHDPNNPYGSQPERGYDQPYPQPPQPYSQPVPPPYDQYGQPIQPYGPPPGQQPMAYGGQPGYYTPAAPPQLRPVGVSIIAVLNWIGGVLMGLFGLLFLVVVVLLGDTASAPSSVAEPLLSLGIVFFGFMMAVFMVIAALAIVVGVGLWRLRNWARITQIILAGLYIVGGLYGLAQRSSGNDASLCLFIAAIAVVAYLLLPATRAAFRR
jgi:hypothetical protein